MELIVSDKSVFTTSFGLKGIYSHLKNISAYRKFLFDVIYLEVRHNGVAFFLTAVDEN